MPEAWAKKPSPRIAPICPRCAYMMRLTRIEPDPGGEPRALLCHFECRCGETLARKDH